MVLPSAHEFLLKHYDTLLYISGIVIRFVLPPVGTLTCYLIMRKNSSSRHTTGICFTVVLLSLFIFAVFGVSFGSISYEVLECWDGRIIGPILYKYIPEKYLGEFILILPWVVKLLYSIVIAILIKIAGKRKSGSSVNGLFVVNAFTTIVMVCLFLFLLWCTFLPEFGVLGVIGVLLVFGLLSVLAVLLVNLPIELSRR